MLKNYREHLHAQRAFAARGRGSGSYSGQRFASRRSNECGAIYPGQTRQQMLGIIAESFYLPKQFAKNYDALTECLTKVLHEAGDQSGFLVVLEQLPSTQKFDKEARENLLDVFRDAADFWAEKKIPFRVFFSFQ